ncbi:hypothetical protein [Kocuria tytonis]|uniref:Uncharacterized protein n=1 Tax=Kocuria tytonis TaxID=2054280 RepID=A0A495A3M8_9MICC|nr:hypothetical protein [Kocuria tytonis]RKQ34215.1 hypothetical protein C1C97_009430 [Kocuria tytonis]
MSEPTAPVSAPTGRRPGRGRGDGISPVLATALVLTAVCALSVVAVLMAAAGHHVLWAGFTIFPAVFFPIAFLLLCVELVRGVRRRSAR